MIPAAFEYVRAVRDAAQRMQPGAGPEAEQVSEQAPTTSAVAGGGA